MASFLKKALMALFLEKPARDKLARRQAARPANPQRPAAPKAGDRPQDSESREELIARALEIQRQKSGELEKLSPREQARLKELAEKMMLGEEKDGDKK